MPVLAADEVILKRFRQALQDTYGDNIERVVLYGSRARGDARPDSDYDVAVFLHRPGRFDDDALRLARIENNLMNDTGAVINALPLRGGSWRERTAFMSELRRDGVDL